MARGHQRFNHVNVISRKNEYVTLLMNLTKILLQQFIWGAQSVRLKIEESLTRFKYHWRHSAVLEQGTLSFFLVQIQPKKTAFDWCIAISKQIAIGNRYMKCPYTISYNSAMLMRWTSSNMATTIPLSLQPIKLWIWYACMCLTSHPQLRSNGDRATS